MKSNLKLLTQPMLLVAILALLFSVFAVQSASASSGYSRQHKAVKKTAHPSTILVHAIAVQDDSAVYSSLRLSNGSVASVVVVNLASNWRLRTVVNKIPATVSATAESYGASIAINGGFFDLRSGRSVSYVVDGTKTVADPHEAGRFSSQILNRSELRMIVGDKGARLDVARHNIPVDSASYISESMQAGPELLPQYQPEAEAFIRKERRGRMVDAISTSSPEARTAIGITAGGKLILVCVGTPGRRADGHGVTLPQLASLLKNLGAVQAVNFDGGSSTQMYVKLTSGKGKVVCGASSMRRVKSVLLLLQHD